MSAAPELAQPCRAVRPGLPLPGRVRWAWLLGTNLRRWRLRRRFRAIAPMVPPGATIIDVGSGPGFASDVLRELLGAGAARRLLFEPQLGMWRGRRNSAGVRRYPELAAGRVAADRADLPLREGAADVALSLGVLCCMPESAVPGAVSELARVLRPGGILIFRVPRRRGPLDEARFRRAGFEVVRRDRPGSVVFRKAH